MADDFIAVVPVFPVPNLENTARFYVDVLGFARQDRLNSAEPHIYLSRDGIQIVLTSAGTSRAYPNRLTYGYGYDAYIVTDEQNKLLEDFALKGARIVVVSGAEGSHNGEFAVEDIDGRWIAFGKPLVQS
ncbi:MAG: VOC family protein [Coriobacteriales bacterium]|jgi:catechol 2,3-dioxygenase-like lactoylglutathione lyase family enzyme|nr:VOC family protein [Coriobacteriales bacterium]